MRRLNPRILFALGLVIVFLPFVIWLASSNQPGAAPDPTCVDSWNQDPVALVLGEHLYLSHGYRAGLMAHRGSGGQDQPCLLVVSASEPDPEYGIPAFIYSRQAGWHKPVAGEATETDLLHRQSKARAHPNVFLSPSGTLVPN